MFLDSTEIRIRYGETDQMGYVYYGNYAQFFEIGRVESLRTLGISYKEMEESGIMLPVVDYAVKYLKPAFYDDKIKIVTRIQSLPTARITFEYEIYNENQELLTSAKTVLVFVKKTTMRPTSPPEKLLTALKQYF